jgi:hypothetical protein
VPYFSWEFCWKMRFKQKLQLSLYFIPKFKEIFHFIYVVFFTFIHFISHLYKLHTPQGVHVTNTWSNLAFWYNENSNKTMLYSGIETGTSKSKYMFCKKYYISLLNQSSWKRHTFFFEDCCKTSRNNLDCYEENHSNKIIYVSRKGSVSYFKQI